MSATQVTMSPTRASYVVPTEDQRAPTGRTGRTDRTDRTRT